jgi:hypothetical protein
VCPTSGILILPPGLSGQAISISLRYDAVRRGVAVDIQSGFGGSDKPQQFEFHVELIGGAVPGQTSA